MKSMLFVSSDLLAHVDMEETLIEVHNLSYFYHWGRNECWNTPCSERGVFNDQIKKQLDAEAKSAKGGTSSHKKYKESK